MAIKSAYSTLITIKNESELKTLLINLLENKIPFELLDPKELPGTHSLIHHYKSKEISKSERHLAEKVINIIDKEVKLRKEPMLVDSRKEVNLTEINANEISFENIYKLEKELKKSTNISDSDLEKFKTYASKIELIEKVNILMNSAFTLSNKEIENKIYYLCIATPTEHQEEFDNLVNELGVTHRQIDWSSKISFWQSNAVMQPFTNLASDLGSVQSKDLDTTNIIGFYYVIFAGFCLADAVYGMIIMAVTGYFLFIAKTKSGIKNMLRLFFYSGLSSYIIGILMGSWGGDLISNEEGKLLHELHIENWGIFEFLRSLQIIEPIQPLAQVPLNKFLLGVNVNPIIALLGFSLFIGISCIISGYVIKMINGYRNKDAQTGNETAAWILLILSLALNAVTISSDGVNKYIGFAILAISILLIFIFNSAKSIVGKLVGTFGTLYEFIPFISDILSFTRLIAVGLTGAIIGNVVNLLALLLFKSMPVPGLNYILLIVFLLAGHGFNLVLSMFSAYINPLRLSYVEYLPKFILSKEKNMRPEKLTLIYQKLNFEN